MIRNISQLKFKGVGVVSWSIFLCTLALVLVTLTSVVFPALLLGSASGLRNILVKVDIFETGIWTYYFLFTNFIIFGLAVLYWKNFLPSIIIRAIKFIFNFEVSRRVAFFVVVGLIGIYIGFNYHEIFLEDPWIDFNRYVGNALKRWSLPNNISGWISATDPPLGLGLGVASMTIFGTYQAIPFIASIASVVLTYLITVEIAKKRFAGIVAVAIVLQSGLFLIYDTTITYPNFGLVFFLGSLYAVYKFWPLSPASFLVAIPAKALTAAFFPINMVFVSRAEIPRRRRIFLLISYAAIAIVGMSIVFSGGSEFLETQLKGLEFDSLKFLSGLTSFSYEFRFDGLIVLFLLPLTVGLFFVCRAGIKTADAVLFMIFWVLFWTALMPALTNFTNNPYRFVPFVTFFAIGVGTLLAKIRS